MVSAAPATQSESKLQQGLAVTGFAKIMVALFLTELAVMFALNSLGVFPRLEQGGITKSILDAFLLIAISAPYIWLILKRQAEALSHKKIAEDNVLLLQKAFENASEAFVVTDDKANIVDVNPAFSIITGYSRAEIIGQNPRILRSGQQDHGFYLAMWDSLRDSGMWQGEISNRRKSGEIYPEWLTINALRDNAGKVTNYIAVFTDITTRKRMEENLLQISNYDTLTGLPNRELMYDRLKSAIDRAGQENTILALVFFDLDRFKHINETLGHKGGDELLKEMARRLCDIAASGDTVSRLAGDEFIILLESVRSLDDIAMTAKKILARISDPCHIGGQELHITASLGIAVYPDDGSDRTTLMKNADAALYRAIEGGGNTYQFYREAMSAHALERLALVSSLRYAIERDELCVYYQPQVDSHTSRIVGMEALVRWRHPHLGMVPPDNFIPLAEENGMIGAIGEWVLRTACRQAKRWDEAGHRLRIGVNISPRQFLQSDIRAQIFAVLDETGLDPRQLEIELTESMLMTNPEEVIAILGDLRARGVQIAIDDFGTGYSSLSHLKHFPIDTLKVDQSFTRDVCDGNDGAAIGAAMVSLAHNLGIKSIAEGVETFGQLEFMRAQDCHEIQGYLFSHPISAQDFELLLKSGGVINTETLSRIHPV